MRAGPSFRTAFLASAGIHLLLAVGLGWAIQRQARDSASAPPAFDTRAEVRLERYSDPDPRSDAVVKLPTDPPPTAPPKPPPEPPPSEPPSAEPSTELREPSPVPDGPPRAQAIAIPRPLPAELLALLRRPASPSVVQPVEARTPPTPMRSAPAWAAKGNPVHGALAASQCVVYVLDASGSMGEWGKFDAARAALIATLKGQSPEVRFQVVVYSGIATTPLRSPPGAGRPASPENVARLIEALHALPAPAGRSQHLEGFRTALRYQPDVVVFFTDADDLPSSAMRGLARQADRPVAIVRAAVTARGVLPVVDVK